MRARVSSKGQVVIPARIREDHGLREGAEIEVLDFGKEIVLIPVGPDPMKGAKGMLKLSKPVAELLREARREEYKFERKKNMRLKKK